MSKSILSVKFKDQTIMRVVDDIDEFYDENEKYSFPFEPFKTYQSLMAVMMRNIPHDSLTEDEIVVKTKEIADALGKEYDLEDSTPQEFSVEYTWDEFECWIRDNTPETTYPEEVKQDLNIKFALEEMLKQRERLVLRIVTTYDARDKVGCVEAIKSTDEAIAKILART